MDANNSIYFYNQLTKFFGKKAQMTGTHLIENTAVATITDKDGRKWEIKMLVEE
ncbi:hypothetical protein SAMN04487895_101618 [Paenibacillus sophorae]|uniref:Uncharacterized protein n=1 Tax=Paenibacillus sophorae TaxID=1333845 RepID=A0A1H8GTG6_9BACL|nr:hypothetical protein [Paenibacillus sophorae]QWU14315.1 hypothetical protein KP014_20630 [Paenibacillus sophorae]SEN46568.1 hypothetical protein SAMN04487895_101618 [Paenibacillus sophorae]